MKWVLREERPVTSDERQHEYFAGVLEKLTASNAHTTRQMTNWTVYVRGGGISAGVQLDFCPNGVAAHEPAPPLAMDDALTFIFPSDGHRSGTVFSADVDKGIIEVGGVRLNIRCATDADGPLPPASGMAAVSWIVGARVP
jgi:hypothetical protein